MAARNISQRLRPQSAGTSGVFWLAALLAAGLSLAAAFLALRGDAVAPAAEPRLTLAAELQARNERIAFFEARAAADPFDFLSLNNLTGQYLQRARETGDVADYGRAELAAARSLEIVPGDNFSGLTGLASVRFVQHDFAAAAELAQRAIALKPANPNGHALLGDAMLNLGRYDEAGVAYDRLLELEAGLPALSRQAELAWLRGDLVNAEDFWRQALRFDDNLPTENRAWAQTQLGLFSFATGDLGAAEDAFDDALKLYPQYLHAQAGLAFVRAAQERWDDAASLLGAAVAQVPVPQYVATLGDVYAAAGREAEAEEQYALVAVIDRLYRSNDINNDLQLALFFADHDLRLDEALAMAQAAYDAAPNVFAADVLAWALFKNGRLDEAGGRIDEALRLGTLDPAMHYHAARIKLAAGDPEAAAAHLRQLERLNPSFSPLHSQDARQMLSMLEKGTLR